MPVGTYVYGIADYGNVIAIAPATDHVEQIWCVVHDGVLRVCLHIELVQVLT